MCWFFSGSRGGGGGGVEYGLMLLFVLVFNGQGLVEFVCSLVTMISAL